MVKHIVSFKLSGTPEQRKEVAEKFKAALLALPAQIDVLRSMEAVSYTHLTLPTSSQV